MHQGKKPEQRNAARTTRASQFVEVVVHEDTVEPQVYRMHVNDVLIEVPEDFDDEVVLRLLHLARAC